MTKKKGNAWQGGGPSVKSWNESLRAVNYSIRKETMLPMNVASSAYITQLGTSIVSSGEAPAVGGASECLPDVTGGIMPVGGLIGNYRGEPTAGFIFMCNGKTKQECYMYRVFGLPIGKLEDVKKIQPGMKLFLFDFDLKLLYGIYEATSYGQMDLEPMAFAHRFPSQVKFRIFKECLPIHESVFRHAIMENYSGFRFKQELHIKQVNSLLELFRPLHSTPPRSLGLQPAAQLPHADGTPVSEVYHASTMNMAKHYQFGHARSHSLHEPYVPEIRSLESKSVAEPQYHIQEVACVHPNQNLQGTMAEPEYHIQEVAHVHMNQNIKGYHRPSRMQTSPYVHYPNGYYTHPAAPTSAPSHSYGMAPSSYPQPLGYHPYGASSSLSHQPYYSGPAHAVQPYGSVPPATYAYGSADSSNQASVLSSQYAVRDAAASFP